MKKILTILFFLMALCSTAQRPVTGVWLAVNMPVSFSKHWQWHNDAGYRTLGLSARPLQYLYRPGIRYRFTRAFSLAAGTAFFFTKADFVTSHHEFGREFRLWQELLLQPVFAQGWSAQLRLRTEQRYFAATSTKTDYDAFRYRVRMAATKKIHSKWSVQLADELMRQSVEKNYSFDQNRLMISGGFHLNTTTQAQVGYMWLRWPAGHQHLLTITWIKNFVLHGGE